MKRIISTVLVCVLLVSSLFALASCGGLSGTYESGATEVTFSMGKATIVDETEILGSVVSKTYEAEYEITEEDGKKYIEFTYEDGADEHLVLSGKKTLSEGEKDGVKYIQIGLVTYNEKK